MILDSLIEPLSRLPGLGKRSGMRAALYLLQNKETRLYPLIEALKHVGDNIKTCETCGNLDDISPCSLCRDETRDTRLLCVVEQVSDLMALERTHAYKGHYFVLGGVLSAIDGIGPENLRMALLEKRLQSCEEIILGLSATVEGQTTAHYIATMAGHLGVTVTALAHGLPMGGELNYLDDATIMTALNARRSL